MESSFDEKVYAINEFPVKSAPTACTDGIVREVATA